MWNDCRKPVGGTDSELFIHVIDTEDHSDGSLLDIELPGEETDHMSRCPAAYRSLGNVNLELFAYHLANGRISGGWATKNVQDQHIPIPVTK